MLNRSLKAGTPVRCSLEGSGHAARHGSGAFTDGKVYTLREAFTATGFYDAVRVVEDDHGNQNGWNAACFVEVNQSPAWDADAVKQLLNSLLQEAVDAREWASARAIIEKMVLF